MHNNTCTPPHTHTHARTSSSPREFTHKANRYPPPRHISAQFWTPRHARACMTPPRTTPALSYKPRAGHCTPARAHVARRTTPAIYRRQLATRNGPTPNGANPLAICKLRVWQPPTTMQRVAPRLGMRSVCAQALDGLPPLNVRRGRCQQPVGDSGRHDHAKLGPHEPLLI